MPKKKESEARMKKAMKHPDVLGAGAKKRKKLPKGEKEHVVMKEFKQGTLNSGSGHKVTNRRQAIAIAIHEAKAAGEPIKPMKSKPAKKKKK
jgi:hypothetical protein